MKENMDRYNIWLTQVFGIANPKIHKVTAKYGSPKLAYEAIQGGDHSVLEHNERQMVGYVNIERTDSLIEYCEKQGIGICSLGSAEYPKLLAEIYDPPCVLFYRGDLSCLDDLSLTFIGSRHPTPYITNLCSRICRDVGKLGITLVSGMAIGVDQCVHRTCVANGIKTVGVLGCGIDIDYPRGSMELRERMASKGGAVISELFPGTEPTKEYFNPRNRIMAGLTRGTAIFQAAANSGTLITGSYAVDENRDVFCIPPPDIFDPVYEGVIGFLEDGAIPIFNHNDILKEYIGLYI
ncbi:MAG: DNA-protecting protein DprA [Ruminiclostridium sp.]|nr:DNA-protecting protein DprA [Ruminiclostridium sp.]